MTYFLPLFGMGYAAHRTQLDPPEDLLIGSRFSQLVLTLADGKKGFPDLGRSQNIDLGPR